jgi:hypothetical protein
VIAGSEALVGYNDGVIDGIVLARNYERFSIFLVRFAWVSSVRFAIKKGDSMAAK